MDKKPTNSNIETPVKTVEIDVVKELDLIETPKNKFLNYLNFFQNIDGFFLIINIICGIILSILFIFFIKERFVNASTGKWIFTSVLLLFSISDPTGIMSLVLAIIFSIISIKNHSAISNALYILSFISLITLKIILSFKKND